LLKSTGSGFLGISEAEIVVKATIIEKIQDEKYGEFFIPESSSVPFIAPQFSPGVRYGMQLPARTGKNGWEKCSVPFSLCPF